MTSLRGRLRWRVLGAFGLVFAVAGTAAYAGVRSLLVAQFDRALRAKAQSLATLVKYHGPGRIELDFADEFTPEFDRATDPEFFQLWGPGGTTIERSRTTKLGPLAPPDAGWPSSTCRDQDLPDGRPGRAVALAFLAQIHVQKRAAALPGQAAPGRGKIIETSGGAGDGDEPEAEHRRVTLVVARGVDDIERPLGAFLAGLLGVGAVMIGGGAAAVEIAVRRGLRPVDDLRREVAAIDSTSLARRVAVEPLVSELAPIAGTLNDLLGRLETAFERQGRFTSSAAHELRNPIAELRAVCEVALRWPTDGAAPEHRALEQALAVARQMDRIVTVLLAMARADGERAPPLGIDEAAVPAIVRELWTALASRAAAREIATTLELAEDGTIRTDAAILRTILGNVLENAAEYTPAGGKILVRSESAAGAVTVTVANTAPFRDPAIVPRLFEPFWRLDPSAGPATHAGLGLPLAERLARSLGGTLRADLTADGELAVALRLPRAPGRDTLESTGREGPPP